MLVVALVSGYLGWNLHQVRTREALLQDFAVRGAVVRSAGPLLGGPTATGPPYSMPVLWRLLGAEPVAAIELPTDIFTHDDVRQIERYCPEADVFLYSRSGGMM